MNQETELPAQELAQETPSARRRFTDDEKAQALKLVEEGKMVKEVAEQFQTSSNTILNWRKASQKVQPAQRKRAGQLKAVAEFAHTAAETARPPKAAPRSESSRLAALQGELARLEKERHAIVEKERDVLKEMTQILLEAS